MSVVDEQTVTIKCDVHGCAIRYTHVPKDRAVETREWLRTRQDWTGDDERDVCGWHATAPTDNEETRA